MTETTSTPIRRSRRLASQQPFSPPLADNSVVVKDRITVRGMRHMRSPSRSASPGFSPIIPGRGHTLNFKRASPQPEPIFVQEDERDRLKDSFYMPRPRLGVRAPPGRPVLVFNKESTTDSDRRRDAMFGLDGSSQQDQQGNRAAQPALPASSRSQPANHVRSRPRGNPSTYQLHRPSPLGRDAQNGASEGFFQRSGLAYIVSSLMLLDLWLLSFRRDGWGQGVPRVLAARAKAAKDTAESYWKKATTSKLGRGVLWAFILLLMVSALKWISPSRVTVPATTIIQPSMSSTSVTLDTMAIPSPPRTVQPPMTVDGPTVTVTSMVTHSSVVTALPDPQMKAQIVELERLVKQMKNDMAARVNENEMTLMKEELAKTKQQIGQLELALKEKPLESPVAVDPIIQQEVAKANKEVAKANKEVAKANKEVEKANQEIERANQEIVNVKNQLAELKDVIAALSLREYVPAASQNVTESVSDAYAHVHVEMLELENQLSQMSVRMTSLHTQTEQLLDRVQVMEQTNKAMINNTPTDNNLNLEVKTLSESIKKIQLQINNMPINNNLDLEVGNLTESIKKMQLQINNTPINNNLDLEVGNLTESIKKMQLQVDHMLLDVNQLGTRNLLEDVIKAPELRDQLSNITMSQIKSALALHDADKTGMMDYALATQGGRVVKEFSSRTFDQGWLARLLLTEPVHDLMLKPQMDAGMCWPMNGSHGYVTIQLSQPIHINSVSIEHLPFSLACPPTNKTSKCHAAAPKDFRIFAHTTLPNTKHDIQPVIQGRYQLDAHTPSLQTYRL
eukprot:Ihof_evm4s328 gene=Ihof_evmTU4s328